MDYVNFGKTGLKASVAGLGCGGHSRLGQSYGASTEDSVNVVRAALDQGVNLIDTAAVYGTEEIVGRAIKDARDKVIVSTKALVVRRENPDADPKRVSPAELRASLETSLKNLGTDYIDVFHLHAVAAPDYDYCRSHLFPELLKFRDEGKVRFFGVTEQFIKDTDHKMLTLALSDDFWDVMMVGFSLLNPSARNRVFAETQKKGIATLDMFAVRKALSDPDALATLLQGLVEEGQVDPNKFDASDPLGFVCADNDATSIANAAYRFCRHEPGVDVVLTGTGNVDHLHENLASICQGPLCETSLKRLNDLFGHIDSVSGN